MTVKRYTPTQCCEHDGTYVTYSDYQKLVAENAALKSIISDIADISLSPAIQEMCAELKLPATDAAIAEIGAKAVEAEFIRTPDAEIKWDGTNLTVQNVRDGFSFGVTPVFVAANLRAGRKG